MARLLPGHPLRRRGPAALRLNHRHHRQESPRPAAPGNHPPVRAGQRRRLHHLRQESKRALRSIEREQRHHRRHRPDLPARDTRDRKTPRQPVRRHHRRSPLIPDRRERTQRPRSPLPENPRRGRVPRRTRHRRRRPGQQPDRTVSQSHPAPEERLLLRLHRHPETEDARTLRAQEPHG